MGQYNRRQSDKIVNRQKKIFNLQNKGDINRTLDLKQYPEMSVTLLDRSDSSACLGTPTIEQYTPQSNDNIKFTNATLVDRRPRDKNNKRKPRQNNKD